MCESGSHFVVCWDPNNPSKVIVQPFRCRSWRHAGECQRFKGRQDFVRVRDGILSRGERWVYIVLTFNQKSETNEWSVYRSGVFRMQKLLQRLMRRFGAIAYVQTWEKHTVTDFPHVNIVISNDRIWQLCQGDGWKQFRQLLTKLAVECGFGFRTWVEPLRAGSGMGLAGYLTKLSRELTGAGIKNQVPVNAPPHFRRLRASRGLLAPVHHPSELVGSLISAKALRSVDLSPEGLAKHQLSIVGHPGKKQGGSHERSKQAAK